MPFKKIIIGSVNELIQLTSGLTGKPVWIYRGVTDERHKLRPSVARTIHSSRKRLVQVADEKQLLARFREQARPHTQLNVDSNLEWLILGQHHGLPTRLLDWTTSPLVAAYFAVESIRSELILKIGRTGKVSSRDENPINGCVYAVRRPPFVRSRHIDPFAIGNVQSIRPPHISGRITRQMAMLTVHNNPNVNWNPIESFRLVIPMEKKFEIKKELDRLGINEGSMFPGIDASARYISWQFKWDQFKRGEAL